MPVPVNQRDPILELYSGITKQRARQDLLLAYPGIYRPFMQVNPVLIKPANNYITYQSGLF